MPDTILITGASSDVGCLLIDRLLAAAGAGDLVIAQGHGDLETLAPLVQKYPGRIRTFDVNLADAAHTALFLDAMEKTLPAPTHFVHLPALRVVNANFKKFDAERFALDMQVQAGSAAAICQRIVPAMSKQKRGRVLFMLTSYILGQPPKNVAAYVMAKQALHGLAQSLAVDYAAHGVTVNCVAPSMMETKFLADTSHLIVQAAAEAHPMGRNATPADVVPAMQFLLGEEAGFITGVVLPITGGV
ncbi:MAG: SDR family oxidoreductase [Ruminococcaceae bacterium]|nr:SDR family oxidoreductase [Oscillospiraceae bacterium]